MFILADDLGVNDLGCYGRKDHRRRTSTGWRGGTPFTSAYCSPICSPTRAAILTGLPARASAPHDVPARPADAPSSCCCTRDAQELPLEEMTLAERLRDAGYATACIGKWHLGGKGFGRPSRASTSYTPARPTPRRRPTEGGKGEYDLTAQAERFIDGTATGRSSSTWRTTTRTSRSPRRPELVEKHKGAFNPTYAAMIETLDDSVGRVLAKLDELGLADSTIVVFTSDNGGLHVLEWPSTPATHNTPYRAGKGYPLRRRPARAAHRRWPGKIPRPCH